MKSKRNVQLCFNILTFAIICFLPRLLSAENLVALTERVNKSTVAIAFHSPLKHSAPVIKGTGFAVNNGSFVITNYHVIDKVTDPTIVEYFVAMLSIGDKIQIQRLELLEVDVEHDLAILRVAEPLLPLILSDETLSPAGTDIAIFGYPLGGALGLFPAVHRGIISTITPDYMPARNSRSLTSKNIRRLKKPDLIYQLDITAYPGNSGSPVVDIESGDVIAVINKVYVKDNKESALSNPSGISYGIPVKHVNVLLERALANQIAK
jgi:serine protease Do